jgi:hypothetical protein
LLTSIESTILERVSRLRIRKGIKTKNKIPTILTIKNPAVVDSSFADAYPKTITGKISGLNKPDITKAQVVDWSTRICCPGIVVI